MALALPMVAALAACGGSDKAQVTTPAQQLAAAKAKADAAPSMHLTLRSSGIPASANGVLGADGSGTHAPAFKGTLDVRISGFGAKVEVVSLDKLLYLKLPFTTEFVPADPKEYNAPDPAQLFATQGGVTSLLTATTNPVEARRPVWGLTSSRPSPGRCQAPAWRSFSMSATPPRPSRSPTASPTPAASCAP